MDKKNKDLENYLTDLDNLIDTGWFSNDSITDYSFNHKGLTLKEFILKGREHIRRYSESIESLDMIAPPIWHTCTTLLCKRKGCGEPMYEWGLCFKHHCQSEHQ